MRDTNLNIYFVACNAEGQKGRRYRDQKRY